MTTPRERDRAKAARAKTVTALLETLRAHGEYASESELGHAFGIPQQTLHSWKESKKDTGTLLAFLMKYAATYRLDPAALVQRHEIRPASARNGTGAEDPKALRELLQRIRLCLLHDEPKGRAWRAFEAVLDLAERKR